MHLSFRIGFLKISTHNLLMGVFSIFFIMKMIRAFAQTSVAGGLWNYIQIFFSAIGVVLMTLYFNKLIRSIPVLMMFIYGTVALVTSLVSVQISRNALFDYLMTPYALFILVIACCDAAANDIEKNLILTVTYYIIAALFIMNFISAGTYDTMTGATADVYYVLGLMPVVTIRTKRFRFIPMIVCGLAVLISGKRTGIFAFILVVIVYYLYYAILNRRYLKVFYYILGFVIIITAFLLLFSLINDSFNDRLLLRLQRFWESGDSSGRNRLWQASAAAMGSSSFWKWLVGHGNLATVALLGNHAHNDFLEVLYDYGIVPLLAYSGFYVSCVIELVRMIRAKYEYAVFFAMSLVIAFSLAMFSFYVIDPTYITAGMIAIGYFLTDFQKKNGSVRPTVHL